MTILAADKRRAEGDEKDREFLVPRVVKVLDTDRIPIRDLIAFHRREETESKGTEHRAHRYREHVEKFVKEMNQLEDPSDVKELRRQYVQDAQGRCCAAEAKVRRCQMGRCLLGRRPTLTVVGESLPLSAPFLIVLIVARMEGRARRHGFPDPTGCGCR